MPSTATSRIDSNTGGNDIQMSTSRDITASTHPPRNPARSPSSDPIRQARPAATNATVSDTRVPNITRESTSRPSPSVPSRKPGSASGKPAGGTVAVRRFCASGSCGATSGAAIAMAIRKRMKPPAQTTFGSRASRTTTDGGCEPLSGVTVVAAGAQRSTRVRSAQACRSRGLSVATVRSTPILIRMKINPNSRTRPWIKGKSRLMTASIARLPMPG